jgi:hypothetical protein
VRWLPTGVRGYRDEPHWAEIQDGMIDAMVQLESALRPHIAALPI